ncbi:MAG: histone-lysine N-methyltransferase [Spirochaetales bacterium]|nr:histone-lysine N-methyltransferase [Spirochaetales bacterium]
MLQQTKHYPLVEPDEPELFRDQFPYSSVPRILFDNTEVPMCPAKEIWITDTTFRDGQQSRPPYTPEQIVKIYSMLHRLGGPRGIIRQSEFFVYSERDRKAVEGCLSLGYEFPEVTGWIRADAGDFRIIRDFGLRETGILTSVSDYHIFLKMKKDRKAVMEQYLSIVRDAIDHGIKPRCHFEDITRADIYGFCIPFAQELALLMEESKVPVKIRLCDTMGYGISYPGAVLPRSIPRMIHAFHKETGYPSSLLEWHGHNDFHKVHINAATAWLYGVSALNASLLGYGERTGNPPLEAAVIEYAGLKGDTNGMELGVITEIAEYYEKEIKAPIPSNYPFVGAEFNTTRAGIHADGLLKNEEIYNIFDTAVILNRPLKVTVTDKSGLAGIARWINENIPSIIHGQTDEVSKRHPGIKHINAWVVEQYEQGRTTSISNEELLAQVKHFLPSLFESESVKVRRAAIDKALKLANKISSSPEIQSLDSLRIEAFLDKVVKKEGSIQLIAVTNLEGQRISQVHTQRGEKGRFRALLNKNFYKHEWFGRVVQTGEAYHSDLFFSKYTGLLIMTAAYPLYDAGGTMYAVMDIDFKFDELVKLLSNIPEEILESRG